MLFKPTSISTSLCISHTTGILIIPPPRSSTVIIYITTQNILPSFIIFMCYQRNPKQVNKGTTEYLGMTQHMRCSIKIIIYINFWTQTVLNFPELITSVKYFPFLGGYTCAITQCESFCRDLGFIFIFNM